MMQSLTVEEFHALLREQGVPRRHLAFRCVICGTVQSMESLIRAGAGASEEDVEKYIGFSCVGRFTSAGPHKPGRPPGHGCDWTLGGLFTLHKVEVILDGGQVQPSFEVATPEEARQLMQSWSAAAEGVAPCRP